MLCWRSDQLSGAGVCGWGMLWWGGGGGLSPGRPVNESSSDRRSCIALDVSIYHWAAFFYITATTVSTTSFVCVCVCACEREPTNRRVRPLTPCPYVISIIQYSLTSWMPRLCEFLQCKIDVIASLNSWLLMVLILGVANLILVLSVNTIKR